jgi:hypothetical protein
MVLKAVAHWRTVQPESVYDERLLGALIIIYQNLALTT